MARGRTGWLRRAGVAALFLVQAGAGGKMAVWAQPGMSQAQRHFGNFPRAEGDASASQNFGGGLTPSPSPPVTLPGNGGGGNVGGGTNWGWPNQGWGGWGGWNGGGWPVYGWGFNRLTYGAWVPGVGTYFGPGYGIWGPGNGYYSGPNYYQNNQNYFIAPPEPLANDPGQRPPGARLAEPEDVNLPRAEPRVLFRPSNDEQRALATRNLGFGDNHFAQQRYREALNRYQAAVRAAPDMASARFRSGHAAFALGRFDQAAREFRQGLLLDPTWPSQGERLDVLYGDNPLARQAHLDRLARTLADNPRQPDGWFVLAVETFASGRRRQSATFFERALELGLQQGFANAFLNEIEDRAAVRAGVDPPHLPPAGPPAAGEVEL